MKLLLDESVPRQLGGFFPDASEVRTVQRILQVELRVVF